ncbi:nucleoside deaminase [Streptomyces sp. AJS327]|uniref:nucleoside deaminase n=1 Tax=Streptomyces sp. AJS327 TaxID=2545265 RepID=UPI0015E036F9|nr:nucleoside deaminase [Streptomyces sp. AJS327]
MTETDRRYLHRTLELAWEAVREGNAPFGAVLVDATGTLRGEGGNRATSDDDLCAHAETEVARRAVRTMTPAELRGSTLYSSAEPCAMCAAALFWAGVGRVVFATGVGEMADMPGEGGFLTLPCRAVFASGGEPTRVAGPVRLPEAEALWAAFLGLAADGGPPDPARVPVSWTDVPPGAR